MGRLANEEARFASMTDSAVSELQAARTQANSEAPLIKTATLPASADVNQVEAELQNLKAQEKTLRDEQKELGLEPSRRETRLQEMPLQVEEAKTKLKSLADQLDVPAITGEAPAMTIARDLGLRAAGQMVQQKLATLQREQDAYLATTDLIAIQLELVTRSVKQIKEQIKTIETRLEEVRQREIKNLAEETNATAEQALEKVDLEELKPYANFNVALATQLLSLIHI